MIALKRGALLLALCGASCAAGAGALDTEMSVKFNKVAEAAASASFKYNSISIKKDVEYIGFVIRDDKGKYYYTVAKGEPRKPHAAATYRLPNGHRLSAVWHTHAGRRWDSLYFSDTDTKLANSRKVPVYMINSHGVLRVFRPGDPVMSKFRARKTGLGPFKGYARGSVVPITETPQTVVPQRLR